MYRSNGLTLVELIVVVAVMSIIAAVAYPLYTTQMQKVRRADAKVALETLALAQERYYTINGEYVDNLSSLQISSTLQGGTSDKGYYTLTVAHPSGDTQQYTLTADTDSSSPQAGDTGCAQFTLNNVGAKSATGDKCW